MVSAWVWQVPCRGEPGTQPPTRPHTHSTKLPMAARGLQETYSSLRTFSARRTARTALESGETQGLMGGPQGAPRGKGPASPWAAFCLPAAPGEAATHAGRHGVGPEWPQAAGRPVCSPGRAPAPQPCHSGTPRCSALQGAGQLCHGASYRPTGPPCVTEPRDQDASGKPFPAGWPPEKAMAPHSSTLAWKIPWTEEPVRLQSMGSLRVGHD